MADLIRRSGSLILRRSALKHPLVWHRKAGTGFTASIAKLTKSLGTNIIRSLAAQLSGEVTGSPAWQGDMLGNGPTAVP
jgi:two-component sensor histidine kinase